MLAAEPPQRAWLLEELATIQRRSAGDLSDEDDFEERASVAVDGYLERALDPGRYGIFNTVAVWMDGREAIGYLHSYIGSLDVGGERVDSLHNSTYLLPSYRGLVLVERAYFAVVLDYVRDHLFSPRDRYYVGFAISPVIYYFIHRRARTIHPSPIHAPSEHLLAVIEAAFGDVMDEDGLVLDLGAPLAPETRAWLEASDDPLIRFYLDKNPRFEEGYGLPFAMPIGVAEFLYMMVATTRIRVEKMLRRGR